MRFQHSFTAVEFDFEIAVDPVGKTLTQSLEAVGTNGVPAKQAQNKAMRAI